VKRVLNKVKLPKVGSNAIVLGQGPTNNAHNTHTKHYKILTNGWTQI
jgi:hypothetical protein